MAINENKFMKVFMALLSDDDNGGGEVTSEDKQKAEEALAEAKRQEAAEEAARQAAAGAEDDEAKKKREAAEDDEAKKKREAAEALAESNRKVAVDNQLKSGLIEKGFDSGHVTEISKFVKYDTLMTESGEVNQESVNELVTAITGIALRVPPTSKNAQEDLSSSATGFSKYLPTK